jgi:cystathionine gamma-synthase
MIDRSTVWPYEDGQPGEFTYQRYGHPTGAAAERELGALEGGDALLFGSGTSAATALVLGLLQPGTTVGLAEGAYFGTGVTLGELARWGLRVVEFDQTGPPPANAQLLWLEAPANPMLTMPDLDAAAAYPAPVVVDSTVATPILLRPLEHGADYALHSATKALGGHDDVLLGVVVCRDPAAAGALRRFRGLTGISPAAEQAQLLLRSLGTLEMRVRQQAAAAAVIAERLRQHPKVAVVRYPGLGGLISFDVADGDTARRVETSTRLVTNATSLGSVHSLIEGRHRWEGDRCPPGLLRLSVGLEDPEEIWADLAQALGNA